MKKLFTKSIYDEEDAIWYIEEFIENLLNTLEGIEDYTETREIYEEIQELVDKIEKVKEEIENEKLISDRYTDSYDYSS
jgi:hypothetical protein